MRREQGLSLRCCDSGANSSNPAALFVQRHKTGNPKLNCSSKIVQASVCSFTGNETLPSACFQKGEVLVEQLNYAETLCSPEETE